MLRSLCLIVAASVFSLTTVYQSVADDKELLQGEWRLIEREHQGKVLKNTDAEFRELFYTIKGNEATSTSPNGKGPRKKTFTIDVINSPKTMDLLSLDGVEKGQTAACIYKLEGDRLTLCMPYFTNNPNQRPKEFKTTENDSVTVIYVFERLK